MTARSPGVPWTVGKLAFDGMDALFPEVHVDVAANEAVLVHGCGSGMPGLRRVTASLVDVYLLACGREALRGIGVSAAVYGWWNGGLVEPAGLEP